MKTVFTLLLLAQTFCAVAQNQLSVKVTGIKEQKGNVEVCLYKEGNGFMNRNKAESCTWLKAESADLTHAFPAINRGKYAVIVIHDLNENKTLDTNFLRIPKEPYGFSNNPSTTFGPPDFEGASFELNDDLEIEVRLK